MSKDSLAGKKVLVMGLGRFGGGVDSAKYAAEAGAKVTVTDTAGADKLAEAVNELDGLGIVFHLGGHIENDFADADVVIANPAVPPENEYLQIASRAGAVVTSAMNIFLRQCPARVVGITGANGKSTTTALTAHILEKGRQQQDTDYPRVWLSGNIGARPLLGILDKIDPDDIVVLEISSFQSELFAHDKISTYIALLTNLTPNHLDRHGTFENYCAAKQNLFKYQKPSHRSKPVSIFNKDDKIAQQWYDLYQKDADRICLKFSADDVENVTRDTFTLAGKANLSNLAAAITVARHLGLNIETIRRTLTDFKPLPHRLELVSEKNGVRWYNDSISTTPDSTIAALDAFEQPKIIIAGGYDKQMPFDTLGREIAAKAKAAVLIGATKNKIAQAINNNPNPRAAVMLAESLEEAVRQAGEEARPGDVVILSPACASYDMFDNFQQRGSDFTRLAREL